jgi:hypothetical protein
MDSFPCVSEARVPGSIPGGSTLSRISPEWEAVCKTVVAGSTPERGSIFGGGAHAMEPSLAVCRLRVAWAYRSVGHDVAVGAPPLDVPAFELLLVKGRVEVASSRIRIRGPCSRTRAMARHCFSPPDSRYPRSPTTVS